MSSRCKLNKAQSDEVLTDETNNKKPFFPNLSDSEREREGETEKERDRGRARERIREKKGKKLTDVECE